MPESIIVYSNPLEKAFWENAGGVGFEAILFVTFVWGGLFLISIRTVDHFFPNNKHLLSVSTVISVVLSVIVYRTNAIGHLMTLIFG